MVLSSFCNPLYFMQSTVYLVNIIYLVIVTHVRFLFDTNPSPARTSNVNNVSLARTVETIIHEYSQPTNK